MTTLYVAAHDALLVVRERADKTWILQEYLQGSAVQCVAVDADRPECVYAGTAGGGLWCSADGGRQWHPAGAGIAHADVTAVAVAARAGGGLGIVYAGTEPSAVFRSTDGGQTWTECAGLTALPSASSWSFPPRPDTHHVRWIGVAPDDPLRLYVAIEAGALVRSADGGLTWQDRVPTGPYDTHTLAVHPAAPGRLYAAAGDGYFETTDGGQSWQEVTSGLRHFYLVGVAVDPADPETVVVSAAAGPGSAYRARDAVTFVYRRRGRASWRQVEQGLPPPRGTTICALAAHPSRPGSFYAATNRGIFASADAGERWRPLDVPWPGRLHPYAVLGLAVAA
jgi:photosystem II stability/assembly factor-like uncharacterized protein